MSSTRHAIAYSNIIIIKLIFTKKHLIYIKGGIKKDENWPELQNRNVIDMSSRQIAKTTS